MSFVARFTSTKRFIKPWMVKYAGEHFEFDTSRARDRLGWSATRYMGDELADICRRARGETSEWKAKNDARPF